jgi:hypothetical protein
MKNAETAFNPDARFIAVLQTKVALSGDEARLDGDSLHLIGSETQRVHLRDVVAVRRTASQMGGYVVGIIGIPVGALIGGATGLAIVSGSLDNNPSAFVYGVLTGATAGFIGGRFIWHRLSTDELDLSRVFENEKAAQLKDFLK